MKYKLNKILEIQKALNQTIFETQQITRASTYDQSHLCIIIELMELCNETRCFNYWSKKTRASDDVILEEFADVMCFLLTELLELEIDELEIDSSIQCEDKKSLTLRFANLIKLYNYLDYNSKASYQKFLNELFNLGYALGYNFDQIYDAYLKKVSKNYSVQADFKV